MKTWFCWIPRFGGDVADGSGGLYRAETRSKARYLCFLHASDPLPDLRITDIRVRREHAFDEGQFRDGVMPQYAELAP